MTHAVSKIGGYDRTQDCRYVHPANPKQLWVSKARAHEINPDATDPLLTALRRSGKGPKANKVNNRLVLYRIEDIARTDFRRLASDNGIGLIDQQQEDPNPRTKDEVSAVDAIRLLNKLIRNGDAKVVQKPDGTLRIIMELE